MPPSPVKGFVSIDSTIGKNTVFTFTWTYSSTPLEIYLYDPQQLMYCTQMSQSSNCAPVSVSLDTTYHTVIFNIDGLATVIQYFTSILYKNNPRYFLPCYIQLRG